MNTYSIMRSSQQLQRPVRSMCQTCRNRTSSNQTSSLLRTQHQPLFPQRHYAQPARLNLPAKIAFKPPPAPPKPPPTVEEGHVPGETEEAVGPFDAFLAKVAQSMKLERATSIPDLYAQYQERGGRMCKFVIPYDEQPAPHRRADTYPDDAHEVGDGLVMVVHAHFKTDGRLDKICACSGFVVNAQLAGNEQEGEVVITCVHTLEEMYRKINKAEDGNSRPSLSVVIPSHGHPRLVQQVLSSMPRSDTVAMQLEPIIGSTARLKALPLSPFPVQSGSTLLTHLFGAPSPPEVTRSQARLPPSAKAHADVEAIEKPIKWLDDQAWRRWGAGNMLGYRSYTNIEVEAGIHSSLPHLLISILPTPGSSGGPIVSAESGAVIGMISGTRMDNRVEGERGWGASAESIFEMFALPGFTPTGT